MLSTAGELHPRNGAGAGNGSVGGMPYVAVIAKDKAAQSLSLVDQANGSTTFSV